MLKQALLLCCIFSTPLTAQTSAFDSWSTGATLRFDYFHSGTSEEEHISLDRIRLEGPWPGRREAMSDETGMGKYRFSVRSLDDATLYSQGFSSIYGEWETTGEAREGTWRSLHESQRFPEPRNPVTLILEKRSPQGEFAEFYRYQLDPNSRFIDRSALSLSGEAWPIFNSGDPSQKVDLLILGDGYAASELESYREDARRVVDALFSFPPFAERKADFNAWGIDVPSPTSGVSRPRSGEWHASPIGLSYNAFDSERYMLSFENARLREVAAQAPYDALILIANSDKYGGGGIFNLYSTAAAKSLQMPYLIVHEFGHAFAGLGDEYYTSQVSYEAFNATGTEPWEPNVTALLDPENLKWRELASSGVPIPTPWNQDTYDATSLAFQEERAKLRAEGASEERMDAYFKTVQETTEPMLLAETYADTVGAFEGASYEAKGLYRPSVDCIMFSRNPDVYCPVCAQAINRVIDLHIGAAN